MSRIKVGGQWIDQGPARARVAGYVAKSATGGLAIVAGKLVAGDPTKQRVRARAFVPGGPPKEHRWEDQPRCGVWMPRMAEPCGRIAGHRDSHRTAYALECERARRAA